MDKLSAFVVYVLQIEMMNYIQWYVWCVWTLAITIGKLTYVYIKVLGLRFLFIYAYADCLNRKKMSSDILVL